MSPQTFTYTWTQTRLETVQDQFHSLMLYAGIKQSGIDHVLAAVGCKEIDALGIFGTDTSKLRVAEIELRVDWSISGRLTLTVPNISGGLPGWRDKEAPEVRVAGRRFAEVAKSMSLTTSYWVNFVPSIRADADRHRALCEKYGLAYKSSIPSWKSTPEERSETLLDLAEANIAIRRAGG